MSYLSRLALNARLRLVRRDLADCQELHRTLLRGFPDGHPEGAGARAEYGVLFRVEGEVDRGTVRVLVQSAIEPDWTRLPEGYLRAAGGELESAVWRPLAPFWDSLTHGERLRFRLRANPTKKVDTKSGPDGARRNGRRVVLTTAEDQIAWLVRKGQVGGFALTSVLAGAGEVPNVRVVDEARQVGHRAAATTAPRSDRLTFGSVLFEGVLAITDRDQFRETLKGGVGSGKAYGFGLLSIARHLG